jgi:hypothetical protein
VEVDRQVVLRRSQAPTEREVGSQSNETTLARRDDHLVQRRVRRDDGSGRRLDEITQMGVGKAIANGSDGRRREDDIADLAQTNQEDLQGSIVASSISMTGMSSLMG